MCREMPAGAWPSTGELIGFGAWGPRGGVVANVEMKAQPQHRATRALTCRENRAASLGDMTSPRDRRRLMLRMLCAWIRAHRCTCRERQGHVLHRTSTGSHRE